MESKSTVRDFDFAKLKEDHKVVMKQLSGRRSDLNQQDTQVGIIVLILYSVQHLRSTAKCAAALGLPNLIDVQIYATTSANALQLIKSQCVGVSKCYAGLCLPYSQTKWCCYW